MQKNRGFTLIELIAVIAILAILAATAVPQFVDLRTEARVAAANGLAGALSSASSMNYAKKVATGTGTVVANCSQLTSVATVGGATITATTTPAEGAYGLNSATLLTVGVVGTCNLYYTQSGVTSNVTFGAVGSN